MTIPTGPTPAPTQEETRHGDLFALLGAVDWLVHEGRAHTTMPDSVIIDEITKRVEEYYAKHMRNLARPLVTFDAETRTPGGPPPGRVNIHAGCRPGCMSHHGIAP